MHIPDGYLSPATCGIMYAAVIPLWARAIVLMRRAFDDRSLPLLAILSAFSFILMMFNVPVPGGDHCACCRRRAYGYFGRSMGCFCR